MVVDSNTDLAAAAKRAVRLLTERGLTLALGESCTGGLIGDLLTDVPGSSRCFLGGIVAYANDAKLRLLDVPPETLTQFGSVSEQTVTAMAKGARERFGADLGLAATGIAGPGGGTPEKPVGLVYLALVAADGRCLVKRVVWHGSRRQNKRQSAGAALGLVETLLSANDQ
jgi:nicotinamide-nucleotide amidase